jgi:predicted PurR-regulated permease PerM
MTDRGPRSRTVDVMSARHRRLITVITVAVAGGILAANATAALLSQLQHLIILVGAALFTSFGMEPAVSALERRGIRRGLGTFGVMAAIAAVLGGLLVAGGAVLVAQGGDLLGNLPAILDAVERQLRAWGFQVDLHRLAAPGGPLDGLGDRAGDVVLRSYGRVLGGLGTLLTFSFVLFYCSADGPRILAAATSLLPPHRQHHVQRAWATAVDKVGGYLWARAILMVISAVTHSAAFAAAGVPYPVPLGVWVGVTSQAIPVLGAYLAAVLPIVVALGSSPGLAVAAFVIVTVYQQIENFVLAPRITRSTVNVHPLVGFLSVFTGLAILGWVGALLAIPIAATVTSLLGDVITRHAVATQAVEATESIDPDGSGSYQPGQPDQDGPGTASSDGR